MPNLKDPIVVGRFGRPFGVKGWIKLHSFTDPAEGILSYQPWHIKTRQGWQEIALQGSELKGESWIVKIKGIEAPETAKQLTTCDIAVERDQLPELDEGEYYWADLVGMKVVTGAGIALGTIENLFETGANDVVVVKDAEGHTHLLPYVPQVIKHIDTETKTVIVDWDVDEEHGR